MSALTIIVARGDSGVVLTAARPGETITRRLDGIDEALLANAVMGIDEVLDPKANPGLCERFMAGDQS